jgi:hypothetical protein
MHAWTYTLSFHVIDPSAANSTGHALHGSPSGYCVLHSSHTCMSHTIFQLPCREICTTWSQIIYIVRKGFEPLGSRITVFSIIPSRGNNTHVKVRWRYYGGHMDHMHGPRSWRTGHHRPHFLPQPLQLESCARYGWLMRHVSLSKRMRRTSLFC